MYEACTAQQHHSPKRPMLQHLCDHGRTFRAATSAVAMAES